MSLEILIGFLKPAEETGFFEHRQYKTQHVEKGENIPQQNLYYQNVNPMISERDNNKQQNFHISHSFISTCVKWLWLTFINVF